MAKTFGELEHEGWMDRAAIYDSNLGQLTCQAIGPILDGFAGGSGALTGKRLLEIACGTGKLAGAAAERGARAEGLDFAAAMVLKAKENFPALTFTEGDMQRLPFEDGTFDFAVCSFGVFHVAKPDVAMAEACRVLKSGGRYAITGWCSPDQGSEVRALVNGTIKELGDPDVELPPGPDGARYSDSAICRAELERAGFAASESRQIEITWRGKSGRELYELFAKSSVRMAMRLDAQTPQTRERIQEAISQGAEQYRQGDWIELTSPAMLTTAVKP